jgi:hypothetical protein
MRALQVDERVGERRARAQPVVGADADPAARGELEHERDALLVLAAEDPGAAVDLEDRRAVRRPVLPAVHVETDRPAALARVLDVADALDFGMGHGEGEEDAAPVDLGGESLLQGGHDALPVVGAEAGLERTLDDELRGPRVQQQRA